MSLDLMQNTLEDSLKKVTSHLAEEFSKLQIGRASASLVEHIEAEAYGGRQNIKALANISVPDARTIQIQPWDKSILQAIEKGIQQSGLGINPSNDGIVIRINIPQLTEERRKDLTKIVHKIAEEAKIAVRNARHEAMEKVKGMEKKSEITEDQLAISEKKIQESVDKANVHF